jgi:hypothetical protein
MSKHDYWQTATLPQRIAGWGCALLLGTVLYTRAAVVAALGVLKGPKRD